MTFTHSDRQAAHDGLFRQILEDPADTTLRLVYADWLEETGETNAAARAHWIRWHCATGLAAAMPADGRRLWLGQATTYAPIERLVRRYPWSRKWQFDRGLVHATAAPVVPFMTHAEKLFALSPLTAVKLLDRSPDLADLDGSPRRVWHRFRKEHARVATVYEFPMLIPEAIWLRLPDRLRVTGLPERLDGWSVTDDEWVGASEDACHEALSAACVSFGRHAAGLPPATGARMADDTRWLMAGTAWAMALLVYYGGPAGLRANENYKTIVTELLRRGSPGWMLRLSLVLWPVTAATGACLLWLFTAAAAITPLAIEWVGSCALLACLASAWAFGVMFAVADSADAIRAAHTTPKRTVKETPVDVNDTSTEARTERFRAWLQAAPPSIRRSATSRYAEAEFANRYVVVCTQSYTPEDNESELEHLECLEHNDLPAACAEVEAWMFEELRTDYSRTAYVVDLDLGRPVEFELVTQVVVQGVPMTPGELDPATRGALEPVLTDLTYAKRQLTAFRSTDGPDRALDAVERCVERLEELVLARARTTADAE